MTKRHTRQEYSQRADLAGEHRIGDIGQMTFALVFSITWGVDTFFLEKTTWLNQWVPLWVRIPLGVLSLVLAGYLARTGLSIVFGEVRERPGVIRKSVFGLMRHPIYTGELLLYLGLLFLSLSAAAAAIGLMIVVFLYLISRYEEKLLLQKYGDDYRRYMQEVPMWLPRLRGRK